jgi:hypothetical protein
VPGESGPSHPMHPMCSGCSQQLGSTHSDAREKCVRASRTIIPLRTVLDLKLCALHPSQLPGWCWPAGGSDRVTGHQVWCNHHHQRCTRCVWLMDGGKGGTARVRLVIERRSQHALRGTCLPRLTCRPHLPVRLLGPRAQTLRAHIVLHQRHGRRAPDQRQRAWPGRARRCAESPGSCLHSRGRPGPWRHSHHHRPRGRHHPARCCTQHRPLSVGAHHPASRWPCCDRPWRGGYHINGLTGLAAVRVGAGGVQ